MPAAVQGVSAVAVAKLVLLSVVIMMFTIPLALGKDRNGRRSLRKMLVLVFMYNVFYYLIVRFVYPRLM